MSQQQRKRNRLWLAQAMEQDDPRCQYCGRPVHLKNRFGGTSATIDHVIPRCQGGSNGPDNRALACRRCNGLKADGTVEQLKERLLALKRPRVVAGQGLFEARA